MRYKEVNMFTDVKPGETEEGVVDNNEQDFAEFESDCERFEKGEDVLKATNKTTQP